MLRRVAAFCRPLRPVLLLVSFPRSRSPAVGVPGLCWMWRDVPFARQRCPVVGVLGVVLVVAPPPPPRESNTKVPKFDGNNTSHCPDTGVALASGGGGGYKGISERTGRSNAASEEGSSNEAPGDVATDSGVRLCSMCGSGKVGSDERRGLIGSGSFCAAKEFFSWAPWVLRVLWVDLLRTEL